MTDIRRYRQERIKDVFLSHLDMQEPEDIQESYFDFDVAIFDFDEEDSLMAVIPLALLTDYEDSFQFKWRLIDDN